MRCRRPHLHSPTLSALLGALVFFNASVVAADGFVVSGHSGSLYDGDEWSELLRSLATVLFIFTVDDEDDSDFLCDPHLYHDPDDWCDELGFSVPQVQLSAGMGYTLSPRLTVGARYLYRRDRRDNEIARLWGGSPEVTLDLGDPGSAVQPFVGGYLLAYPGGAAQGESPPVPGHQLRGSGGPARHDVPGRRVVAAVGISERPVSRSRPGPCGESQRHRGTGPAPGPGVTAQAAAGPGPQYTTATVRRTLSERASPEILSFTT